jgi:hypothetical protein
MITSIALEDEVWVTKPLRDLNTKTRLHTTNSVQKAQLW